jgi:RNA polymerase sigma factor (sigma-70 family)
MPSGDSVSRWIDGLKAGDQAAATRVWNHFYARLVALACRKLRDLPRRAADEEDVALSAFETLFRRVKEGRFPRLHDRCGLWRLLVKITERKALNQMRDQRRQKRGGDRVRGESAVFAPGGSSGRAGIDGLAGAEPTPEFAAILAEDLRRLLEGLADDELRAIALWKLEGRTHQEIAEKAGRSLPTIERRLRLIRDQWRQHCC